MRRCPAARGRRPPGSPRRPLRRRRLRSRVSTFPRSGSTTASGCAAKSWARRRSDDVPTRIPGRSHSRSSRTTRTSRGSARSGTAPIASPSSSSDGQVLRRVHGQVDLALAQRLRDRVGPQALRAGGAPGACALVAAGREGHDHGVDLLGVERGADGLGLGAGQRRAARPDPQGPHDGSSRSTPRRSASSRACARSDAGSLRAFSSTIGSCRSLAAMPRASASTASRSSGGEGRTAGSRGARARRARRRRRAR